MKSLILESKINSKGKHNFHYTEVSKSNKIIFVLAVSMFTCTLYFDSCLHSD